MRFTHGARRVKERVTKFSQSVALPVTPNSYQVEGSHREK